MSFDSKSILNHLSQGEKVYELILNFLAKNCAKDGKVSVPLLDEEQCLAYDLAWMKSEIEASRQIVAYADRIGGKIEQGLAEFFVANALTSISGKIGEIFGRMGVNPEDLGKNIWSEGVLAFIAQSGCPKKASALTDLMNDKDSFGDYGLTDEQGMIRDTFKKFAEENVRPHTEKVHREDLLIPEDILKGLTEMGCFGLSIPQQYGGFQDDAKPDHMGMLVVTEELSRGSLGIAGSLITRPEILSKAIIKGGTDEQKTKWLPLLATGEKMAGVAVTEPDFGSDVSGMRVMATETEGGYLLNGVKTWCTYAGYADSIMVLARTNPDPKSGHRGLSILIAEKPRFEGHSFEYTQEGGGLIEGKAIPTIGYRGMHSFEVAFENYFVPKENLIGGDAGLGRGFYLQMEGFAGGRIQTAARATGVMQAAMEAGLSYSNDRKVFNKPIIDYQITKYKIAKMASIIQACRQLTYYAAGLMDEGKGTVEASLVKFYSSKVAEWVTREAMQLHGGMGYAEEFPVSRYYVDARVFSIFEGAEDVLALRVIARTLVDEQIKKDL